MNPRISVIIPTLNEEGAIGRVLADLPRESVTEVIVVDSGSTDRTRDVAATAGARVVVEPRRGYGRACLTGLNHVSSPDIVVFLDGDYSDRPAELPRLLAPLLTGGADMVIGSRLSGRRERGALPWHSVVGNRLLAFLINRLCPVRLSDLGPFRAVRYNALRAMDLQELTYGWPVEMIVKGAQSGLRIVEVPVSYHPRIGHSKITGTLRGSVGAAWCLTTGIVKHTRRRVRTVSAGSRALVIMAKAPGTGRAKTRLLARYSPEQVESLYHCFLRDTLDAAMRLPGAHVAIMCPAGDQDGVRRVVGRAADVVVQDGEGLAHALDTVFRHFVAAGFDRVIAYNSDTPHLPVAVLDAALAALDAHDAVVGPTEDGGYYLIGATAVHPGLFQGDRLGTGAALEGLLGRLHERSLRTAVLEPCYDVDIATDLERLRADLEAHPERAPRTAALLAEWGE